MKSKSTESLADYVRRVRAWRKLSTTDVERLSGNKISDSYITRIENSYVKNVSPEKLQALAKGLGVSEDEVFAIARGKSVSGDLELEEMRLVEYFRTLPPKRRGDALAYLEMMSERYGRDEDAERDILLPIIDLRVNAGPPGQVMEISKRSGKKRA